MSTIESNGNSASSVQDELLAIRAKRKALEDARAKRLEPTESELLSRERRELADQEALDAAITEHGKPGVKIAVIETTIGMVIVKRASANRFRAFQDRGEFNSLECDRLVRPSLVHPDADTFDRMIEEQPAIIIDASNAISALAGVRKVAVEKK